MIRPDRKFILKVLLLLVFLPFYLWAQNAPECSYCGKEITGKYLEAEGKYFHPRHFLCAKCRKVITASFMEKDGKFFHPDCYSVSEGLVCNFCNKIIKSEYVTESGKKYHPDCYESNVAPKCSICGKALTGDYSIDLYNNKYHSYHNRELSRCDNCGRIISERTTKGGKSYSDGRNICNICFKDAVFDNSQINSLLSKVILSLKTLGLQINSKALTIRGVNRSELKKAAGNRYDKNMHGFCKSSTRNEYINDRLAKSVSSYTIYVLNGVPRLNLESVIAHELMHVWMNSNTKDNHSDELREGSCNFVSYLYLKSLRTPEARQIIKMLESDDDDVYGRGFQKVKSEFEDRGLTHLMKYLKGSNYSL